MVKKFRLVIDIFLFIIFIILNLFDFGNLIHEILGICFGIFVIIHFLLNFKWFIGISLNFNRVNKRSKILYVISLVLFILCVLTLVFGILSSRSLFRINGNFGLIHMILGNLLLIIMFIHLYLNVSLFKRYKFIYILVSFIICFYSLYRLVHSFEWFMFMERI